MKEARKRCALSIPEGTCSAGNCSGPSGQKGIMVEHGHVLKLDTGFYEGKEPWPLTSCDSSPTPAASTDDLIQQLRAVSDQYKNGGLKE